MGRALPAASRTRVPAAKLLPPGVGLEVVQFDGSSPLRTAVRSGVFRARLVGAGCGGPCLVGARLVGTGLSGALRSGFGGYGGALLAGVSGQGADVDALQCVRSRVQAQLQHVHHSQPDRRGHHPYLQQPPPVRPGRRRHRLASRHHRADLCLDRRHDVLRDRLGGRHHTFSDRLGGRHHMLDDRLGGRHHTFSDGLGGRDNPFDHSLSGRHDRAGHLAHDGGRVPHRGGHVPGDPRRLHSQVLQLPYLVLRIVLRRRDHGVLHRVRARRHGVPRLVVTRGHRVQRARDLSLVTSSGQPRS
jgi:hypothetical protein